MQLRSSSSSARLAGSPEKLISEVEVQLMIQHGRPGRDQTLLRVAYYGALRVADASNIRRSPSSNASMTWTAVR